MKRTEETATAADVLAVLTAELQDEASGRAPRDLRDLVAGLLEATPGEVSAEDLAAYYDQSLAPADRERMQGTLASDPSALADLIALDEVMQAFAAHGSHGTPEEAAARAAQELAPLKPHRPAPAGDGVETLLPGKVAKSSDPPAPAGVTEGSALPRVVLVAALVVVLILVGRACLG